MTHATRREQQAFKLRSLTFSVYPPTLLFSIGEGAVIPIIPLFARNRGASVAAAALVVAMRGLGTLLFDLPSGVVVSRFGDKGAMVTGTALVAVVAIGASLSRSAFVLAVLILVMGGGWAFWQVARLAYVSEVTPLRHRGRALSLLGGISRAGTLIGPILGGFLSKHYGLESAFYAQAAMGVAASALMFNVVRKASVEEASRGVSAGGRLVATVVAHRRIFPSAGLAVIALQMMRQCRDVFLPLWGSAIGLDVDQIGLVYRCRDVLSRRLCHGSLGPQMGERPKPFDFIPGVSHPAPDQRALRLHPRGHAYRGGQWSGSGDSHDLRRRLFTGWSAG